jgi:hypothetical protein
VTQVDAGEANRRLAGILARFRRRVNCNCILCTMSSRHGLAVGRLPRLTQSGQRRSAASCSGSAAHRVNL